jgi:hypothetical protein
MMPDIFTNRFRLWLTFLPVWIAYRLVWLAAGTRNDDAKDVYMSMWMAGLDLPVRQELVNKLLDGGLISEANHDH